MIGDLTRQLTVKGQEMRGSANKPGTRKSKFRYFFRSKITQAYLALSIA